MKRIILATLCIMAVPSVALANMGTPLMWAGMLHLVFGNCLIGLLEGILLAKVFGLPKVKSILLLILANYFSAWLGVLVMSNFDLDQLPLGLHNAWSVTWLMVAGTYVLTLALEFPFVALVFRRQPSWFRGAVRASLLIQTVSYGLIVGWYWMASGTSLYTQNEIVDLASMSLPPGVRVYFIAAADGDVYTGLLAGGQWSKVAELQSEHHNDRLFARPMSPDAGPCDLVARLESADGENPDFVTVKERFANEVAPQPAHINVDPSGYPGTWMNFGRAPKVGDAQASQWEFSAGFWPIEGLAGAFGNSKSKVMLAWETPFSQWSVRNASHLPGDMVLFQLGRDQICVYDPVGRRVALVVNGRGPVVALDAHDEDKNLPQATATQVNAEFGAH